MKMLKKIAIPVLLIATLLLTFTLTSCKKCSHEYGEWTVTKEATCTVDGTQERTCSSCGETEKQAIKATGHAMEELLCGVCGEAVVGVESLLPILDPSSLSSVGVVIKDIILTEEHEDYTVVRTIELAELVIYIDENGALAGYGEGTLTENNNIDGVSHNSAYFYLENDMIYVSLDFEDSDAVTTISLESIMADEPELEQAIAMINELLPAIELWFNESLLPCFTGVTLPEGVEAPELTEENAKKALTTILDLFFKVEQTEGGATVVLDLSVIKEVNNALNEKTVAELIDLIGGEGTFLQLQLLIPRLLDYSLDDLIKFINLNLGVNIPAFLSSLDELAAIVTGSEEVTFEMLVGIEGDIDAILADEEFLAIDVKTLLMSALELTEQTELDAFINEVVGMLNATTVYQLLEVSQSDAELINDVVDELMTAISYKITVDKTGKFVKAELDANIPEQQLFITVDITAEKIYFNANDGRGKNNITVELISNYTPNPDKEKLAEIKERISAIPEINEEIIAQNKGKPIYAEDGTTIVGMEYYDFTTSEIRNEDGSWTVGFEVDVIDFEDIGMRSIESFGCGSKAYYDLGFIVLSENRVITIDEATVNELRELDPSYTINDICKWIFFNSEVDYSVTETETDTTSIYFAFDSATGEVIDSADHRTFYDEEQSILIEDVACGETYKYVYACTDCDFCNVDEYVKEHGEESTVASVEFDEENGIYTVVYDCACGNANNYATIYVNVSESEIPIIITSVEGEEGDPIGFRLEIVDSGTYQLTISEANQSGYIHWYNSSHIKTTYYDADIVNDATLDLDSAKECVFDLFFFSYEQTNSITISVTPIALNG